MDHMNGNAYHEEKVATRVVPNGFKRLKVQTMSPSRSKCESLKSKQTVVGAKESKTSFPKPEEAEKWGLRWGLTRPRQSRRPKGQVSNGDGARSKVKETLRLFYGHCKRIIQEAEASSKEKKKGTKLRVDYKAAQKLKKEGKHLNSDKKILGNVPGVEVGDEFQYRMELNILGINMQCQGGIDYMKDEDGELVATCIVSSGSYDDEVDSDVLIYTGQGGNVTKGQKKGERYREPKDQVLERGNLALANSQRMNKLVRVIRGFKKTSPKVLDGSEIYVYDGLYTVETFWPETGSHGKLVYKFKLRRIPGQPELSWNALKKAKTSKKRKGLCDDDISGGEERFPICAVNEVDDEKPPQFTYMVKMTYPDSCKPIPKTSYCRCIKGCTGCACVQKNDGEDLPYNHDGALVYPTPFVYECGPRCECPLTCSLRVTQRGLKYRLELFKTESRGWGVRSLNSIPSGSFVCELVELLEENEAERLTGKDEYLFDIGIGNAEDEPSGFVIDAARKGNIARFINHSCSPNLIAQNVLYDHEDKRMPHLMFFAQENIAPLQELTCHYHYEIDHVRDSDGNIKSKECCCGSSNCTGRLY